MKYKKLLIPLLILSVVSGYCGKLEDFADDFDFIRKNCRTVENLSSRASYRKEFELKMFRLQQEASILEKTAIEIGIRDVTLGSDTKLFLDSINVKSKSKIRQEQYDIRRFAISDIQKQISYLKNLQFSFEERSFVPNQYYMDDLNIQIRFARKWKVCQDIAFSKTAYSPFVVKEYKKRYFSEIEKMARQIEEKLKKDRIKISKDFQLVSHVAMFYSNWNTNMEYVKSDYRAGNRIRMTPEYASRVNEMKIIAESIDRDLDLLAATGFRLMLPDSRFIRQRQQEQERLEKEEKKAARKQEMNQQEKMVAVDNERLEALYQKRKDAVYKSESGINGFSKKLYDNFKALHPMRQQKEMDQICSQYMKESYPAALARSMAAREIYRKYQGKNHGCEETEMLKILNISAKEVAE